MGVVYRYTDLSDGIIKYVGIVWSDNRTLKQRVDEHFRNDDWCKGRKWKVEFLKRNINSRTDAELFESHYISEYATDKYYNIKKSGWGKSDLINSKNEEWELYQVGNEENSVIFTNDYIDDIYDSDIVRNFHLQNEDITVEVPLFYTPLIYDDCYFLCKGSVLFEYLKHKARCCSKVKLLFSGNDRSYQECIFLNRDTLDEIFSVKKGIITIFDKKLFDYFQYREDFYSVVSKDDFDDIYDFCKFSRTKDETIKLKIIQGVNYEKEI